MEEGCSLEKTIPDWELGSRREGYCRTVCKETEWIYCVFMCQEPRERERERECEQESERANLNLSLLEVRTKENR